MVGAIKAASFNVGIEVGGGVIGEDKVGFGALGRSIGSGHGVEGREGRAEVLEGGFLD